LAFRAAAASRGRPLGALARMAFASPFSPPGVRAIKGEAEKCAGKKRR
jgi:hypothetical protein